MCKLAFYNRPATGETGVAETLRNRSDLDKILIYGDWFGDDDAEELGAALASNTSLIQLFLNSCSIGARGLRSIGGALKVNETLTALILTDIDIGDAGAEIMADALVSNSSLSCLDLDSCGIGAVGLKAIVKAYEISASLTCMVIINNKNIGDAGASVVTDFLATTKSLELLNLSGCGISEQGAMAIGRAWGTNLALPMKFNFFFLDRDAFGVYQEAERIRGLVLERRDKLVAFGMATIPRLGGIRAANAGQKTRSSTSEECVFRFMNKDVLRLIGQAYGDY